MFRARKGSDHPPNLIVGRCPRFPVFWADTFEVGEGFIFTAAAVLAKWGLSFDYTVQIRVDWIDLFHTFQPDSIFSSSPTLDNL